MLHIINAIQINTWESYLIHRKGPILANEFIVFLKIMIFILFQGFFEEIKFFRPFFKRALANYSY